MLDTVVRDYPEYGIVAGTVLALSEDDAARSHQWLKWVFGTGQDPAAHAFAW